MSEIGYIVKHPNGVHAIGVVFTSEIGAQAFAWRNNLTKAAGFSIEEVES